MKAVKFLYLNRTAFAGMYRLNKKGKFNVPFNGGERGTSCLCETPILFDASRSLRHVKLLEADFERVIREAGAGDVVYCDPTYTVAHSNNGFIRYNENNFSWRDQERLIIAAEDELADGVEDRPVQDEIPHFRGLVSNCLGQV